MTIDKEANPYEVNGANGEEKEKWVWAAYSQLNEGGDGRARRERDREKGEVLGSAAQRESGVGGCFGPIRGETRPNHFQAHICHTIQQKKSFTTCKKCC